MANCVHAESIPDAKLLLRQPQPTANRLYVDLGGMWTTYVPSWAVPSAKARACSSPRMMLSPILSYLGPQSPVSIHNLLRDVMNLPQARGSFDFFRSGEFAQNDSAKAGTSWGRRQFVAHPKVCPPEGRLRLNG
jgi:hypothetical protein